MNSTVTGLMLLSSMAGAVHEDTASQIVERGFHHIAVCPRALLQTPQGEVVDFASVGPNSIQWAADIHAGLKQTVSAKGKFAGRFQVVAMKDAERAFRGRSAGELVDAAFHESLREQLGADALAVVVARPLGRRKYLHTIRVIPLNGERKVISNVEVEFKTISQAAYAGESWELRRWVNLRSGETLQPVAVKLDNPEASGVGNVYEHMQYVNLDVTAKHPLLDSSCPYGFRVLVDDKERQLEEIGGKLFIALEAGESYVIDMWNKTARDAYFMLFVDGANTLNGEVQRPADAAGHEVWWMTPDTDHALVRGWTKNDGSAKGEVDLFKVVPFSEAVAGSQGFSDNLGMITALVYTKGFTDVPKAEPIIDRAAPGTFGTGRGSRKVREMQYDENAETRGVMLAAMTVYYRTRAQLDVLKAEYAKRQSLANADPKSVKIVPRPVKPETSGHGSSKGKPPATKRPSETTPFPEDVSKPTVKKTAPETQAFPG